MPKRENQPGFFVCAEKRTELILTRFVPESSPDDTLHPEETNLKILVVFANPSELGRRLNADEFLEKIAAMKRVEVKSITKEAATRQDVERVIGEFKPHVFHFIGHGDAEKGIALMRTPEEIEEYLNETGDIKDVEWVDGRGLNSMFANAHPRLVFLHACNGATADSMNGFNSTAHDLVYSYRVPAVIAMQYAIENGAAARFARTFYQQISDGSSIDIAVSEGRWELRQSQRGEFADPAFGTPIVYVQNERAESAIIDHRAEEAETPRVVSCPYGCGGFVVVGTPFCGTCKQPLTGEAGVAQATASSSTRDSQVETGHGGVAPELADTQEPTSSGLSATVDGVKELTRIE